MSALEILKAARALISDPARWIQTGQAVDAQGRGCWPWRAARWSMFGALWYVQHRHDLPDTPLMDDAYSALCRAADPHDAYSDGSKLETYNRNHTHPEILALFDAAIARLESEAAHA